MQYTNQVLESIVPLLWSKQLNDDKAPFVMNIVHILQTDKPTHKWIFSFKITFHKAY